MCLKADLKSKEDITTEVNYMELFLSWTIDKAVQYDLWKWPLK